MSVSFGWRGKGSPGKAMQPSDRRQAGVAHVLGKDPAGSPAASLGLVEGLVSALDGGRGDPAGMDDGSRAEGRQR